MMTLDEIQRSILQQQDYFIRHYGYAPDTVLVSRNMFYTLISDPRMHRKQDGIVRFSGLQVITANDLVADHVRVALIGDYHAK